MKKNIAIVVLAMLTIALFWHSIKVELQYFQIKGNVQTITLLKNSALASTNVTTVVENMDYILTLTPGRDGRSIERNIGVLLDGFIEDALDVMIIHLKQITGHDLGKDPHVWINEYDDKLERLTITNSSPKGVKP